MESSWILYADVECCCWSGWYYFGRRRKKSTNRILKRVTRSAPTEAYYYGYAPTGVSSVPNPVTLSMLLGEIAAATLSEIMSGIEMIVSKQDALELVELVKSLMPTSENEGYWPAEKCE